MSRPDFPALAAARWYLHKDRGEPEAFALVERRRVGGSVVLLEFELAFAGAGPLRYLAPWDGERSAFAWDDPGFIASLFPEVAGPESTVRPLADGTTHPCLRVGAAVALKFYPFVEDGENPEIELLPALARVAPALVPGSRGVARVGDHPLALAMDFVAGADDGWALALGLARAGNGGALDGLAARAGRATADLHAALRGLHGVGAGGHQRIHGDLHLGQLLVAPDRIVFLDFEGSPLHPAERRRAPASPLADVAGLARSFDYAALSARGPSAAAESGRLAAEARAALLAAYFERAGTGLGLDAAAFGSGVATLERERARYELDYERRSRPGWAWIPAAALKRFGIE